MDLTAALICGITLFLIYLIHLLSKGRKKNEATKPERICRNCGTLISHHDGDSNNFNLLPEAGIEKEPINALTTGNPVEVHQNQSIKNENHPRDSVNHSVTTINQITNNEKGLSHENHITNEETGQLLKAATILETSTIEERATSDPPNCSWDFKGDGKEICKAETEAKKNDESMRPKISMEQVYEKPRSRDAESPKRSHSVSFVLNPSNIREIPNRSNSISFVVNTPRANHYISCKIGKSNQFMTETVPENPSCSHEETPGANKVSDYLSTHPVKLRHHLPEQMDLSHYRYSTGVRPDTMASLDSLEFNFLYHPNCFIKDVLNGHSQADSLSYMQSSCSRGSSSEVSITKRHAILINIQDARNSILSRTDEMTDFSDNEQRYQALLESTHMNPKLEHSTLVASSGVVGIAGCLAKFEKDTFKKPVQVKLICYFPKQVSTDSYIIVTPEVHCIIVDDVKHLKTFTITLPTCYITSHITISTKLTVQHCSNDGRWQAMASVEHGKSLNIEFESSLNPSKPGRYRCVAPHTECMKLCKSLIAVGFLILDVDSNFFTIVLCVMDNLPHLQANMWLEMSPPSVYKRILPTSTFIAEYGQGLDLIVCGKANEFDPDTFRIEKQEIWKTVLFKKFEYRIPKSLDFTNTISFSITNDNCKTLLGFRDFYMTDVKNYLSEERPVFIDSELSHQRIVNSQQDETDSECASSSVFGASTQRRTMSCAALVESSKQDKMSSGKKLKKIKKFVIRKFSKH